MNAANKLYIGIDLGTSACRVFAIDATGRVQGRARVALPLPYRVGAKVEQDANVWWDAVRAAMHDLSTQISLADVRAIAVDGTSGTLLFADDNGVPLGPALMYNDARGIVEAECIAAHAPRASAAHGASGGLAKLLYLQKHLDRRAHYALNQADWINGKLTGRFGLSDENNCAKLGFDPVLRCWPDWLGVLGARRDLLPKVVQPGAPLGCIDKQLNREFNFSPDAVVVAGTTDSTAAIIATGVHVPGAGVTSLGSTLVMKVISERPLFAPEYGVYSQRLGDSWLVGGGSNSGAAVLLHYFSQEQIEAMTPKLQPGRPTGLDFYPLISAGERFPVNDATLAPRLLPRPADGVCFFQGMLESMARIELEGYRRLAALGAPYPSSVCSVGGGAANEGWTMIRERLLGIAMIEPAQREAAYGAALLALSACSMDAKSV